MIIPPMRKKLATVPVFGKRCSICSRAIGRPNIPPFIVSIPVIPKVPEACEYTLEVRVFPPSSGARVAVDVSVLRVINAAGGARPTSFQSLPAIAVLPVLVMLGVLANPTVETRSDRELSTRMRPLKLFFFGEREN